MQTLGTNGVLYSNEYVLDQIERLLGQDFVDYGYGKVAAWLRQEGLVINGKKVYRLMAEKHWLQCRIQRNRYGKKLAKELLPNPGEPFACMQVDIKYIYLHGQNRNALLITLLDVLSRGALGYRLAWNIRKEQVIELMQEVLYHYRLPEKVSLRTDNGSQFESGKVREYLCEMQIEHEFTHVASPQENCYIESFHSIVEACVCRKYEFETMEEAQRIFAQFMNFYNQERIHGGIGKMSPQRFLCRLGAKQKLRLFPVPNVDEETCDDLNKRLVESYS